MGYIPWAGGAVSGGDSNRIVVTAMNSNFIALQHLKQEMARQGKHEEFIEYVKQCYGFGFFNEEDENVE